MIGPPIAALGLYMLSTLTVGSSQVNAYLYTFIFGLGLGMIQANYTVAAQNVLGKKDIGVGTAMTRLFQNMGMTVGVTVLGSVINQQMVTQLATNLPAGSAAMLPSTNINDLRRSVAESDGLSTNTYHGPGRYPALAEQQPDIHVPCGGRNRFDRSHHWSDHQERTDEKR